MDRRVFFGVAVAVLKCLRLVKEQAEKSVEAVGSILAEEQAEPPEEVVRSRVVL
jgi:hypothetical protein